VSRIETLLKLETILEDFLDRAADAGLESVSAGKSIEALGAIASESLRGRFVSNRLGDWLAKNKTRLNGNRFDSRGLTAIGNFLQDIRTGLDEDDPETEKLREEIDYWKQRGAKPRKTLVLHRGPEINDDDVTEKFLKIARTQFELLEYYKDKKMHLLTMLDDSLKAAEAKTDPAYLHLAGSLIYFLKINGYKVDPYVKKLKTLENKDRVAKK